MRYIRIRYIHKDTGEVRVDYKGTAGTNEINSWHRLFAASDLQHAKRPGEFTADFRKEVTYEED